MPQVEITEKSLKVMRNADNNNDDGVGNLDWRAKCLEILHAWFGEG